MFRWGLKSPPSLDHSDHSAAKPSQPPVSAPRSQIRWTLIFGLRNQNSLRSQIADLRSQIPALIILINQVLKPSDLRSQIPALRSQITAIKPQISNLKTSKKEIWSKTAKDPCPRLTLALRSIPPPIYLDKAISPATSGAPKLKVATPGVSLNRHCAKVIWQT